jgi:hypothetical protein
MSKRSSMVVAVWAATLVLAVFGIVPGAQAQVITATTTGSGAWTTPGNWDTGIVPDSTNTNVEIGHAMTVGATDDIDVRDFRFNAGASLSIAAGGNINLTRSISLEGPDWDSSSGYTFGGSQAPAFLGNDSLTWTHNGDLDLSGVLLRRGNGLKHSIAGSGLLELNGVTLGWNFGDSDHFDLEVMRDLTAGFILPNDGTRTPGDYVQLTLAGGTTTTSDLFTLGTTAGEGVVDFTSSSAILKVLSSDLSTSAASQAITDGYIMDGTSLGLQVGTDGVYTMISVIPEPATLHLLGMTGLVFMVRRRLRR